MSKTKQWRELKERVTVLTKRASAVIAAESDKIAKECGQLPPDHFELRSGGALVTVNRFGAHISYIQVDGAQTDHWSGTLDDWLALEPEVKKLTDPEIVRELLLERI